MKRNEKGEVKMKLERDWSSGREVESSVHQMFGLLGFPVIFSSLPTWSLISLRLRVPGVTCSLLNIFPPCYLLVWPPCVKPLSAHAQFALPPSLSELSSYTSQTFNSVTLLVQVAAVFLLHWKKYKHSFLQFTQLITNPKYFLWNSLREKRMNNIVPVNPIRLVCLDRVYLHYKLSLLGLDNIYFSAWEAVMQDSYICTVLRDSFSLTHTKICRICHRVIYDCF